jgi:uncharacterized phage protein gp47/JayE
MAGITAAGFIRDTYDEILEKHVQRIKTQVGADTDVSPTSPDGQWARAEARAFDELWQEMEAAFYQTRISSADGINLDEVGSLRGVRRNDETKAVVGMTFSGTPSTTVPAGTIVATQQGIQFSTLIEAEIGGGGTVSIQAQALEAGFAGLVTAGAVSILVTTVAGVTSVTNPLPSTSGRDVEGDPDYRSRIEESDAVGGSSDFGITATLRQLPGVIKAVVYSNKTFVEDLAGVPPLSIEAIVIGGVDDDIFEALYQQAPADVGFFGDEEVTIVDDGGESHVIRFSRPTELEIFVEVNITANLSWTAAQIPFVQTSIVQAIGGLDTVDTLTTEYPGLDIGAPVRTWELIANLDEIGVIGIDAVEILVGTSEPPTEDTILSIQARQKATTVTANVTVNVS